MVDNNIKIRKLNIITMLQLLVPINVMFIRISRLCAIYVLLFTNDIRHNDRHVTVNLRI